MLSQLLLSDACEPWISHFVSCFHTLPIVLRVCKLLHPTVFVSSVFAPIRALRAKRFTIVRLFNDGCWAGVWLHIVTTKHQSMHMKRTSLQWERKKMRKRKIKEIKSKSWINNSSAGSGSEQINQSRHWFLHQSVVRNKNVPRKATWKLKTT